MRKRFLCLFFAVILVSASAFAVTAHPGSLDGNGGHYDRSTGKYHYHHGYSAHQHENGECPYDFNDAVEYDYEKSTSSNQKHPSPKRNLNNKPEPTSSSKKHSSTKSNLNNNQKPNSLIVVSCLGLGIVILITICYYSILFYKVKQTKNCILSKRSYNEEGLIVGKDIRQGRYNAYLFHSNKGSIIFLKYGIITRSITIDGLTRIKLKKGQNIILCNCRFLGMDIMPTFPQNTEEGKTYLYGDEPKDEFIKKYSGVPISSVIDTPETIKHIDKHGNITFADPKHTYGDYSVYVSDTGKVIHSIYGCSNAFTEVNLLRLPYKYSKDLRCKRCFNTPPSALFDNKWLSAYQKIILRKVEYGIDDMPTSLVDSHNLIIGYKRAFIDEQKQKQDNCLIHEYMIGTDLPASTIYFLIDNLTEPSFVRVTTKDNRSYDYLISQNNLSLNLKYDKKIEMFNCSLDWGKMI